jgi:superfamily II DNA or RNA helicase
MDYAAGYRRCISVIVTHSTFACDEFQRALARLQGPVVFIADEAHHLGAEQRRQSYPEHVPFRLALSATPDRWFDASRLRKIPAPGSGSWLSLPAGSFRGLWR